MGRILVVEDEGITAALIRDELARTGHEVIAAVPSGEEALSEAAMRRPDLVLMDIGLTGSLDGIEVARRLRSEYATPVVFLSSFTDERTLARAKQVDPHGYLVKPFDVQTLRTTIEVALRRYELETRLALSERLAAIGALAAGLAHEINNPLTAVIGNLGYALEHVARSASLLAQLEPGARSSFAFRGAGARTKAGLTALTEAREALDDALLSAERVAQIIQDLRRFARAEGEHEQLLELPAVLDLALRVAGGIAQERARFRRLDGHVPKVRASEGRLTQVLTNLLVNAVQAVAELPHRGGEITVATTTDERGWAVVEVRDTGPGMSPEVLARAFDPFFTTKPIGTGMGLGLSLAHAMVTAMGGELTARSELGRGSVFRVALPPAVSREHDMTLPAGGHDAATRTDPPVRVVVLDDEEPVGQAVARMLREGYQVTTLTTPSALFARLMAGERWDVVLCDVMLPEIDGSVVHERVAAIDPELARHTVFISGGVLDPRVEARLAALPNALLLKPFTPQQLRAAVRAAAESRTAPRA